MINKEILELLEQDARLTPEEISTMTNIPEAEVRKQIERMEEEKIIAKYTTITNTEKIPGMEPGVEAFIEVHVSPERSTGFDSVAQRIYNFSEVKSLYLMSGGYDLLVIIEGTDLKKIATFVYQKLATIENVKSTKTHFLLKKYKEKGALLFDKKNTERLAVSP